MEVCRVWEGTFGGGVCHTVETSNALNINNDEFMFRKTDVYVLE